MNRNYLQIIMFLVIFVLIIGGVGYIWSRWLVDREGIPNEVPKAAMEGVVPKPNEPALIKVVEEGDKEARGNVGGTLNNNIGGETLDTTHWKVYTNKKFGITLKYPKQWSTKELPVFPRTTEYYDLYLSIYSPGEERSLGTIQLRASSYEKAKQYSAPKSDLSDGFWGSGVFVEYWENDRKLLLETHPRSRGERSPYLVTRIKEVKNRKYLVKYRFYPDGGGVASQYITYTKDYRWEFNYDFAERNDLLPKSDNEILDFLNNLEQRSNIDIGTEEKLLLLKQLAENLELGA